MFESIVVDRVAVPVAVVVTVVLLRRFFGGSVLAFLCLFGQEQVSDTTSAIAMMDSEETSANIQSNRACTASWHFPTTVNPSSSIFHTREAERQKPTGRRQLTCQHVTFKGRQWGIIEGMKNR